MNLLSELSAIAKKLKIPAQTAVYSGNAPDEYLVFTPLYDSFELHADNAPNAEVQEVRISLFSKNNYSRAASRLVRALLCADIITMPLTRRKITKWRRYNGNNRS